LDDCSYPGEAIVAVVVAKIRISNGGRVLSRGLHLSLLFQLLQQQFARVKCKRRSNI